MMPGGGGLAGPSGPGPVLPFAGIPPEYRDQVDALIRDEPEPIVRPEELAQRRAVESEPFGIRSFLLPHWRPLAVAFALIATEQVAVHAGPLLMKVGIDEGILAARPDVLLGVVAAYVATIAAQWALSWARTSFTGRLGQRLMYALRLSVFSHLQRLGLDFYTRERTGRIMARMTSDIAALATLFHEGLINLVVQALTLVVVVSFLVVLSPTLSAYLLLGIVPPMLGLTLWFRGASGRAYADVRERIAHVLSDLQESLSGVRIVAMHNRQRHNILRHRNVLGRHCDANLRTGQIAAIYGPTTGALDVAGQSLVFLVGGSMVLRGELQVGELAAFALYVGTVFAPIQELVQLYNTYQSGNAAVTKLREVMARPSNVPEAPEARPLPPAQGNICFEHVTFGYHAHTTVLHEVDLHIPAGETFALVGATGSGKSTLAKLLNRLYDPWQGTVRIDGHDLRELTLASLRRQVGVVPQEPFLFAGTLRDNIAFARPEASDAEVQEACRAVGITELVDRLPLGIHTPCHERGGTLSSGERQLVALARAFLAGPRLLVLDEATSSLDLQTESRIEHALDVLLQGRTAILIAHRLSTAMRAQRIGVMHEGRLVELGSHAELMDQQGRYARMFATWIQQGQSHSGT